MAVTAVHGKGAFFTLSDATGSTFQLSLSQDDMGLDRGLDTAEVTVFGDDDRAYIPGLRNATFNVSGTFASTHIERLDPMLGHSTSLTCVYGPGGSSTGAYQAAFAAFLTASNIGSPVGDRVAWSGTMQVTGAVTSTSF